MDKNALSVKYRTCRNVYASSTNQTLKRFTGAPGTRRLGHPRRTHSAQANPPMQRVKVSSDLQHFNQIPKDLESDSTPSIYPYVFD